MDEPTQDSLGRFHRALVEEILRTRPLYLSEPFTVSEIYQSLVPYRTHRDRIGVQMNGDYEDVLLRLLAGEGQYLVLESEHARREIEQELKAQNPNTGLYREYAAVDVRLNPLRMPRNLPDPASPHAEQRVALGVPDPASFGQPETPAGAGTGSASAGSAGRPAASAASGGPAPKPAAPKAPSKAAPAEPLGDELPLPAVRSTAAVPAGSTGGAASSPESSTPSNCLWCREPLPRRDMLNYCPFCGADLHKAPCPNCGEELEVGWRFCVACGTGVDDRA